MRDIVQFDSRTAVITGAASGIGRALAVALARRRCNLALADVNEIGLSKTVELVSVYATHVSKHRLDVSDRQAVAAFPQDVLLHHQGIDILINNAGVAVGGAFDRVSEADFEWLFDINFWGVVRMTRAFLPMLKASDDAHIVNLSSLYGLISPPGQAAYSASKFAVRGFSNALRHELEGTRVGVTVVHPGGVATSIADNARLPDGVSQDEAAQQVAQTKSRLRLPPEQAAEIVIEGIERRAKRILVGTDAKIISLIERFAPVSYWKALKLLVRRK